VKSSIYGVIFQNILLEDMVAGDGGAFGTAQEPIYSPNNITSGDTYARGDSRNIFRNAKIKIQRRNNIPNLITGKRKKKRKKGKKRS
jgi:hypothetical protein